jgi:6-phosphofructokinase 2
VATKEGVSRIVPPSVKIQSTVGAGDSMVAGVIYYLSQGKSMVEAAQYGVACGTAATLNPGTELCRKEDVDKLYPLVSTFDYGIIDVSHFPI